MQRAAEHTDESLIAGIRQDDDRALSYLYKLHYPMVAHFILSNSGTSDEAKDIFQEGILVFYEKIKDGTLELTCQIKTYLYSVCRRLWLKKLAEKNRFSGVIDSENFIGLEDEPVAPEETELKFSVMEQAMNQLGEPCRTLLEDFYLQARSMQDITEKFGYTNADNAKNQKYKCLMRLKKLFFAAYKTVAPAQ
ncbi:sigma-70 family RNA polymerase sigma factor [Adhaeribacter sp. BT258]|uniref:Sigma-70 family RNA polymerase sigma factor n=1 Tax=Adhaeribacter terrigena TaxID=2793070 RepID=A0ABS1C699_9BACT|nr:sigma-70 family RNA polymerase sigma factor [Adhaeribacter terrigena]MBK0404828.1 sigma-70 family RNA polymerase sigma factor [Adhaeribacter terrigena]